MHLPIFLRNIKAMLHLWTKFGAQLDPHDVLTIYTAIKIVIMSCIKKTFKFLLHSMLQAISITKNMMTSRTYLPTRDDNCAGTLRMQSRILEAAHLMQEHVHYLVFLCLFNDAVLPTLSYETFRVKRHGVSNGG